MRRRFNPGDVLFQPTSGKYYRVEPFKTVIGMRYLLRSLDSSNPGRPKTRQFLDLQIEDGEFVRMTYRQYLHATR